MYILALFLKTILQWNLLMGHSWDRGKCPLNRGWGGVCFALESATCRYYTNNNCNIVYVCEIKKGKKRYYTKLIQLAKLYMLNSHKFQFIDLCETGYVIF